MITKNVGNKVGKNRKLQKHVWKSLTICENFESQKSSETRQKKAWKIRKQVRRSQKYQNYLKQFETSSETFRKLNRTRPKKYGHVWKSVHTFLTQIRKTSRQVWKIWLCSLVAVHVRKVRRCGLPLCFIIVLLRFFIAALKVPGVR